MASPIRKITDFKGQLTGGGARSNLFEVEMAFPGDLAIDNDTLTKSRYLCKTSIYNSISIIRI